MEKLQTKAPESQMHQCADGGRENKQRVQGGCDEQEEELATLLPALA